MSYYSTAKTFVAQYLTVIIGIFLVNKGARMQQQHEVSDNQIRAPSTPLVFQFQAAVKAIQLDL